MKDEIKEILEYFRKYATIRENTMINEIEDCITNLQEENKRLHTRIKTIKRRRKAQTAKMRKYREEITNKQNSIVDYKSRNEKANEYIKDTCWYPELENYSNMTDDEVIDLLNILEKGE